MIIRGLQGTDLNALKSIHEKFYQHEFDFVDFTNKFLCAFAVIKNDKIICGGGVRTIAESVIITDKECNIKDRRAALLQVLDASSFVAGKSDYDQLHAFVQDENWERHLKKIGFIDTIGKSLILNL